MEGGRRVKKAGSVVWGGGEFLEEKTSFSFVTSPHPLNVSTVKCGPEIRGCGLPSMSVQAKTLKTQVPQNEPDT